MKAILVIEDDLVFQSLVVEYLKGAGYNVDAADGPLEGMELFKQKQYDLILSDYDMNSVNGLQFFEVIRKQDPEIKFIILTGVGDDTVEMRGLELEVDEYIKKPVSFDVLLKRIENVLLQEKKIKSTRSNLISKNENIFIDVQNKKVFKNDEVVRITLTEYNILVHLLENKNKTIPRDELLDEVWRGNEFIDTRAVDTHIKNLRAKLGIMSIYSVRGVGYEWVE